MKKTISLMACLLCCLMAGAQSMKVVLDKNGEVLGRYVRTNATTYTACLQDDYEVPKAGNRVVTFSAVNGDGIVYPTPMTVWAR